MNQQSIRKYDGTLARVAGNIASALVMHPEFGPNAETVRKSVELAEAIVQEIERRAVRADARERPTP